MALDVGELRATLRLDRDEFDSDLDQAQQRFRRLGDTAEQQGQRAAGSFNGIGQGIRRETDQAEGHMRRLGQSGEQAGRNLGQGVQSGAAQGMRGIGGIGQNAGGEMGAGIEGGMAGRLAGLGRAAGPVGAAIMGIAAIGAVVGAKLADNIMAGLEKQAAAGLAKAKFGWTPEQAATVGKAAGDAYVRNFGASIDENRDAIGLAIQRRIVGADATAEEMGKVAEKMSTIGKTMETDSKDIAVGVSAMLSTGLAKDADEAFDMLARAQQKGLNIRGELMETMEEYGTTYRTIGLDGATALGSIEQLMNAGARNVDQAADAVKEFGVNVTAVSKETTAAFERIGLNANDTYAAFAKGGESAKEMSQTVISRLQGIEDPMVRNEVGLALFKTKWEDVAGAIKGLDFTTAAQQFGTFGGSAKQMAGDMGGAASDIESAKRAVEKSMGEVQIKLAETFGPHLAEAAQWVSEHTGEISRGFEIVGGVVTTVGGAVGMVGGTIIGAVGETIEATAKLVRGVLGPIFTGMEKLGGLMAKMPGQAGELGEALQKGAAGGRAWIDTWVEAGEATSDFGWGMARVSTSITQAGLDLAGGTEKAKTATEAFGDLGIKVREVPDEKRIVIEDNSPETKAAIEQLGIKVQTLPDGTVYIDAQDEDAKAKIAEITKPETKQVTVQVTEARTGSFSVQDRNGNTVLQAPAQDTKVGAPGKSTGGIGSRANADGSTTHTRGGKVVDANGKPTGASANPVKPTQTQQTSEEIEDAQKAKDKADKAAAAAKAKTAKEQAAAAKKAADAQAKIPGLESALAIAEQKVRELKPTASTSSRMSAEQSVTKAREALEKAREAAKGATATSADGKPVTVTGDGKGGAVQVGTGSNPLQVEPANSTGEGMAVRVTNWPAGGIGGGIKLSLFANGGIEDHTAQIARGGDMRVWAEPETEGEAYIPLASSKRGRSMGILRQVAARFGQRLTAYEDGGITNGLQSGAASLRQIIMDQFGITDIGGYRAADGYNEHSTGRALDVMVADAAKGTAVKDFVIANAKALGLKWAIWQQAMWYPDGSTKPMEDRGSPTQNHMDHVHVFLDESSNGQTFSLDGVAGAGAAQLAEVGSLTAQSTKEQIAAAIISEGRKRGFNDQQIRAVLATVLTEDRDFNPKVSGGVQGSAGEVLGLFQQGVGYGSAEDRTDPNKAITAFYNRLGETTGDDIYKRITGVQQHGGSYQGTAGDVGYMDQIQSNATAADELFSKVAGSLGAGSQLTTTGTGAKTPTGTSGAQNVYVTGGKLDSIGAGAGGSQFKFSLFNTGGHVRGPGTSTSDSIPAMLSDGEYVVRAASARANYSLLETINRSGGPLRLAGGGGIGIAPKIEAPKITPTLGPGMALPVPAAAPQVGVGTGASFDPLASLGLGAGAKQGDVAGTGDAVTPQQRDIQRTVQLGGDLAKVGIQALKEILLPSGLQSSQAENVLSLVKGVGSGISTSAQKAESTRTTKSGDGKNVTTNTTHNWYVSSADEAYRNLKRDEGRKALTYDGSLP